MSRRLPVYDHRVRVRHTVLQGGRVDTCRTAYCTIAQATKRLEECANCDKYRGLAYDPSAKRARVRCEAPPADGRVFTILDDRVVCVRDAVTTDDIPPRVRSHRAGHMIVVGASGEPVGVLYGDRASGRSRPVRQVMRPVTLRVPENASIRLAANLLPLSGVDDTPVVEADGSVVGSLSSAHIREWRGRRS